MVARPMDFQAGARERPRGKVMSNHFDLIVLGGGPAGTSGAASAGFLGKRVALVERLPVLGGAGINTGTIPSKTLRETALVLSGLRSRELYGVDLSLRGEATVADETDGGDDEAARAAGSGVMPAEPRDSYRSSRSFRRSLAV